MTAAWRMMDVTGCQRFDHRQDACACSAEVRAGDVVLLATDGVAMDNLLCSCFVLFAILKWTQ